MIQKKAARFGLVLAGCSLGMAQDELPTITVTATRFAAPVSETTSSVTVFTTEELEWMQQTRLTDALTLAPGAESLSTGGLTGNLGTAIVRGLSTKYVQAVVDGVRVSDSTNGLGNFLANGHLGNIDSLEVLRGPQSVLYGSGAAGGVIGYETQVGDEEPTFEILGEAGSYGTYRTAFSSKGRIDQLAYSFEAGFFRTDNDTYAALSRHDYEQFYKTLALEWAVRDYLKVKLSYRGSDNDLDVTSNSGFGPSDAEIETEMELFALNVDYEINPFWTTRFTLGYYDEENVSNFGGFLITRDYERYTANWNNRIELHDDFELIAGVEYSESDFRNMIGSDLREVDYRTLGAYAKATWQATEALLIDGGIRGEEHHSFGGNKAWDIGAAYSFVESGTRFKARFSESFRTPSLIDSEAFTPIFGTPQRANSNLETEEISGLELGLEKDIAGHLFELTFFQQELEDAIVASAASVVGGVLSYENINQSGTSRVSGFEIGMSGAFLEENLRYRLAWTAQTKEEVLDIPDRQIDFDLGYTAENFSLGYGLSYLEGATYFVNGPQADNRVLSRIYGSYQVTEEFSLYGRVENLFDKEYTQAGGFEGQGRAFVLGAKLSW